MNIITSIVGWFDLVRPTPDPAAVSVQIGCKLEEESEFLSALGHGPLAEELSKLADKYKRGEVEVPQEWDVHTLIEVLDALCDSTVTNVGVATFLGADFEGALAEVDNSNYSKFVAGEPTFDTNGKLAKGPEFSPPALLGFSRRGAFPGATRLDAALQRIETLQSQLQYARQEREARERRQASLAERFANTARTGNLHEFVRAALEHHPMTEEQAKLVTGLCDRIPRGYEHLV